MTNLRSLFALGLGLTIFGFTATASSADYPKQTVKIIVPFTAGGTTDLITRALANEMEKALGGSVVVENKNGAVGTLGTADVAKSRPDGYTIGMLPVGPLTTQPHLRQVPYSVDSFDYVCRVYSSPQVLAVRRDSPFKTVGDFVSYAKAHPDALKYGTTGPGTVPYLAMLQLAKAADVKIVHVPFKGEANILTALLGKHVDAMVSHAAFVVDHADTIKALGIMAKERSPLLPKLETLREQHVPVDSTVWGGLAVAAGTPKNILQKLDSACKTAIESDSFKDRMAKLKTPAAYMNAGDFTKFVHEESDSFKRLLGKAQ